MQIKAEDLLSTRIVKHCLKLYENKHFKDAAREAMIQVEQALKEKGMVKSNLFGQNLIVSLFKMGGKNENVKLRVPLGEDLQGAAQKLFEGAFSYYRNYAAHDGSKINAQISLRILIIASELLDLIDASHLSFEDLGSVDDIVEATGFGNKEMLAKLLNTMDGLCCPDGGLYDILFEDGFTDLQIGAVFDLQFISYNEELVHPTVEELIIGENAELIGCCELTDLGRQVVEEIEKG